MFPEMKYASPDGRYVFHISAWEARMSHLIESFSLVEAASGVVVFKPDDSNWSLDEAQWSSEAIVTLRVRKYPGDHTPPSFEITLDCATGMAELKGGRTVPLKMLSQALDELYHAS